MSCNVLCTDKILKIKIMKNFSFISVLVIYLIVIIREFNIQQQVCLGLNVDA